MKCLSRNWVKCLDLAKSWKSRSREYSRMSSSWSYLSIYSSFRWRRSSSWNSIRYMIKQFKGLKGTDFWYRSARPASQCRASINMHLWIRLSSIKRRSSRLWIKCRPWSPSSIWASCQMPSQSISASNKLSDMDRSSNWLPNALRKRSTWRALREMASQLHLLGAEFEAHRPLWSKSRDSWSNSFPVWTSTKSTSLWTIFHSWLILLLFKAELTPKPLKHRSTSWLSSQKMRSSLTTARMTPVPKRNLQQMISCSHPWTNLHHLQRSNNRQRKGQKDQCLPWKALLRSRSPREDTMKSIQVARRRANDRRKHTSRGSRKLCRSSATEQDLLGSGWAPRASKSYQSSRLMVLESVNCEVILCGNPLKKVQASWLREEIITIDSCAEASPWRPQTHHTPTFELLGLVLSKGLAMIARMTTHLTHVADRQEKERSKTTATPLTLTERKTWSMNQNRYSCLVDTTQWRTELRPRAIKEKHPTSTLSHWPPSAMPAQPNLHPGRIRTRSSRKLFNRNQNMTHGWPYQKAKSLVWMMIACKTDKMKHSIKIDENE